ncbi:MAG TPA: tetratricopeptide repeat protein [Blastocatellia bacterium]|nr:tetratricopeptide repeat protein [Blastocatellia bacterium]
MKTRIETLEEFVAKDPSDAFSRYALALELAKAGREDDALVEFKEVIARDSAYVAAYYQLGRLLAKAGAADEARDVYRRGLAAAGAAGDQRTRSELQEALDALD